MTELLVLNVLKRVMQAVTLDGSRVRTLVSDLDESPDGVVVDQQRGHIYWTNMGTPDPGAPQGVEPSFFTRNGSIERVDLDGTNRQTIVARGAFTTGKQLTADFADGKLYWADREGMQLLRCDLDGSNLETLVVAAVGDDAAPDARNHCIGVAVDPRRRLIYWSQKGAPNAGQGRIFRAALDIPPGHTAADRDDLELLWADLPEPIDLDLGRDGTLVWTDRGDPPDGNTLNRARVDPEIGKPQICSRGYHEAIGLASPDGVTYYVGDLARGSIHVVDLADGTTRELVDLGPGLTGLALADL
jgi:sugar lactone lactonase YvrE